jgi:trafficking protein particle complex subunit 11
MRSTRAVKEYFPASEFTLNHHYFLEYYQGDELAHVCHVAFTHSEDEDSNNIAVSSLGSYLICWRRYCGFSLRKENNVTFHYLHRIRSNGERGSVSTSVFPLPSLSPPVEGLLALLSVPPTATLHVPITLTLTIRNYHPSKSANVAVQLELDASDGFVIAGLRSGRIPILMPGAEEKLTWKLIPIECGYVKVPRIKVMDLRRTPASNVESGAEEAESKSEMVKVIDVRIDHSTVPDGAGQSRMDYRAEESIVLVLP